MAIEPEAYATPGEFRTAMSGTDVAWVSDEQDAAINADIKAVSAWVNTYCRRFFGKDSAATAFIVLPRYESSVLDLPVEIASTPTGVKIDTDQDGLFTDEDAVTGFEAWPLEAAYGPEPRPYDQLYLPPWASQTVWIPGQRVQVTAVRGWLAVPSAIRAATIQLTGILRLQSPRATTRYQEDVGAVIGASREAQNIVRNLLDAYKIASAR